MDYSADVYKEMSLIPIYDMSLDTQKLLLTMLILNAKPCSLSIGKLYVSSHEFFIDLIRMSLSFAMVLHSTQKT
ncbi:hypothetical protein KPH14_006223 [Odynerus spinipes]|uniref:Uncharacterized protein n=1 Tax=Odynerus spinipes TaxID=1348599 RepID=A0AAD9RIY4_9HYME|nr:hypothetical protein KPH14_006223 [Odynerus spinipes]